MGLVEGYPFYVLSHHTRMRRVAKEERNSRVEGYSRHSLACITAVSKRGGHVVRKPVLRRDLASVTITTNNSNTSLKELKCCYWESLGYLRVCV